MSGPVSNGLAQLEDALLEVGIDSAFVFSELQKSFDGVHLWLQTREDPNATTEFRRNVRARRQMLWDQLAALRPAWRELQLERDLADWRLEVGARELPSVARTHTIDGGRTSITRAQYDAWQQDQLLNVAYLTKPESRKASG